RADGLARNGRAYFSYLGLSRFLLCGGIVILRARDNVLLYEFLHSAVIHFGQVALRLDVGQLSPLLTRVELHQYVAGVHLLARLEIDAVYGIRKIGTDRDIMDRYCCANHIHGRWPLLLL